MSDTALVKYTAQQTQLIRDSYAKGATESEFALFIEIAQRKGLDIFSRQIHLVKRWDSALGREVMEAQTGIDGYRLMADRSHKYEGQIGPLWCGPDGEWKDIWLGDQPPAAAKVGVLKAGCRSPFWAVAIYREYVQTKKDGTPNAMWRKMGANQLAKCAEALALRKAFPAELAGIYTQEEMGQAQNGGPLNTHNEREDAIETEIVDEETRLSATEALHLAIESELKEIFLAAGQPESEWSGVYNQIGLADRSLIEKQELLKKWRAAAAKKNGAAKPEPAPPAVDPDPPKLTADHHALNGLVKQLLDAGTLTQKEIDAHLARICAGEYEVEKLNPADAAKALPSLQQLADNSARKKGATK